MIWIDYVIIVIMVISCLRGLLLGFVHEILSLLILICAFYIASNYYVYISTWFNDIENVFLKNSFAVIILFITILVIGHFFKKKINFLIYKIGLSKLDKLIGICFGILRGIVIIAVFLVFINDFTRYSRNEDWQNSQLIPHFNFLIKWFSNYLESLI